jgi:hypothetical protein
MSCRRRSLACVRLLHLLTISETHFTITPSRRQHASALRTTCILSTEAVVPIPTTGSRPRQVL